MPGMNVYKEVILLPDILHGFEYLEVVKDIFVDKKYDKYNKSQKE